MIDNNLLPPPLLDPLRCVFPACTEVVMQSDNERPLEYLDRAERRGWKVMSVKTTNHSTGDKEFGIVGLCPTHNQQQEDETE